jgi:hypothetical protein
MKKISTIALVISFLLSSCYYNNLTEIQPGQNLSLECDSNAANITFQKTIQPILSANCGTNNSCHNESSSNPKLNTYEGVKVVAADGRLVNAINHTPGASPMPKSSNTRIPRCSRAQIELWVAGGFLNN